MIKQSRNEEFDDELGSCVQLLLPLLPNYLLRARSCELMQCVSISLKSTQSNRLKVPCRVLSQFEQMID